MADRDTLEVEGKSDIDKSAMLPERRAYLFRDLVDLGRRRGLVWLSIVLGMLGLCLAYCLLVSKQYEASSRVVLRMQTSSSLSIEAAETIAPASILTSPLQLETMVNVFRSERLAWGVIRGMKLYDSPGFSRDFETRFAHFDAANPSPEAEGYLLERFQKKLKVRALPRTLLVEIRFRSTDAALSAEVVNHLVQGYIATEGAARMEATRRDATWLDVQLHELREQVAIKEERLAEFERVHNFTSAQQTMPGGQAQETLHDPTTLQVDEAGRLLAAASGDRVLREALYREAAQGDPEQVLAANPGLAAEVGPDGGTLMQQLKARASQVSLELVQLKAEHGPNFPRVVELDREAADIQWQVRMQDSDLTEAFRRAWKSSLEREHMLRQQLDDRLAEAVKQNDATIQYAVLHEEIQSDRSLCSRLQSRIQEAGFAAGVHASTIVVLDAARVPFKAVAPDIPLYMAIAGFVGVWFGLAVALLMDLFGVTARMPQKTAVALALTALLAFWGGPHGSCQAPTPSTSGLPSGVVRTPIEDRPVPRPNAREAPPVWGGVASAVPAREPDQSWQPASMAGMGMALPIAGGDFLEINEFHTPEFRSAVRVAADGSVLLPLVGTIGLMGLSEQQASLRIDKALVDGGMLLHPQVSVVVVSAVGQDVSVMGEVTRPGIYSYGLHHRLLDLIAAASGLSANAGRLVSVIHRNDPRTAYPVVLQPNFVASGVGMASPDTSLHSASVGRTGIGAQARSDAVVDHNPELAPGDTVLVSRAGLAYVIGDVVRPGGFAVDPVQGLTVVQAISLAWGATPNAAATKAILIRDQAGGRTLTTLNLHRMIRGQDPDQPVKDRDILFVPDSASRTLLNKSLESAIQSAIGVSIYAGLVYSQRF